jgi:hypothetical protein
LCNMPEMPGDAGIGMRGLLRVCNFSKYITSTCQTLLQHWRLGSQEIKPNELTMEDNSNCLRKMHPLLYFGNIHSSSKLL